MISEKIVRCVEAMQRQAAADQLTRAAFNRTCAQLRTLADQVWQMERSAGPMPMRVVEGDNVIQVDFIKDGRDAAR